MESLSTKWKQLISTCRDGLLSQRGKQGAQSQSGHDHLVALSLDSIRFYPFLHFRSLFGRPVPLMPNLFSRSHTTSSPLKP